VICCRSVTKRVRQGQQSNKVNIIVFRLHTYLSDVDGGNHLTFATTHHLNKPREPRPLEFAVTIDDAVLKAPNQSFEVFWVVPLYPIAAFAQGIRATQDVAAELFDRFAMNVLDNDHLALRRFFLDCTLHRCCDS